MRSILTPFVIGGVGYGREDTKLTSWQCQPKLSSGPLAAFGGGADVKLTRQLRIGFEWRVTTLPIAQQTCSSAQFDDEPLGPPRNELSQRLALTVSVRDF